MSGFVALNHFEYTFALGFFETEAEAQEVYFHYLTSHSNFDEWFQAIQPIFKEEFGKELKTMDDFKETILDDTECEYMDFWNDNHVDATVEYAKKGELFRFDQWTEWITTNLYTLVNAILKREFYSVNVKYLASEYPSLS